MIFLFTIVIDWMLYWSIICLQFLFLLIVVFKLELFFLIGLIVSPNFDFSVLETVAFLYAF